LLLQSVQAGELSSAQRLQEGFMAATSDAENYVPTEKAVQAAGIEPRA